MIFCKLVTGIIRISLFIFEVSWMLTQTYLKKHELFRYRNLDLDLLFLFLLYLQATTRTRSLKGYGAKKKSEYDDFRAGTKISRHPKS